MNIPTYDIPSSPILLLGFAGIAVALFTLYTVNKAYFNSPFRGWYENSYPNIVLRNSCSNSCIRPIYRIRLMNYWKKAEQTNGRLAMMGFFAAVVNYGFTGWVIPGIFWPNRSLHHSQLRVTFTPNNLKRRTTMTPEAEKFNGWMAMLGFVAALGAYATTGQIIPGIF